MLHSGGVSPGPQDRNEDLEVASDFVYRWAALPKEHRARLGKQIPVAAVQVAALSHPDLGMRRFCLFPAGSLRKRPFLRTPFAALRRR